MLLIAVKSCRKDHGRGAHELVRETWGRDVVGMDAHLKFFTGRGSSATHPDEVVLDCPDEYAGIALKTQAIARYAVEKNYDHAFFCDSNSFVLPHHFGTTEFQKFDYVGYCPYRAEPFDFVLYGDPPNGLQAAYIEECYPWASGPGYFLSRRALEIVAATDPVIWAEDLWVSLLLASHGIFLENKAEQGFKGFIADWASPFDRFEPRSWMVDMDAKARRLCQTEGCDKPNWGGPSIPLRAAPCPFCFFTPNTKHHRCERKTQAINGLL